MQPAARMGDVHACPMVDAAIHGGGPIATGSPTVFVGGLPAARMGDNATCVGPTAQVAMGNPFVFINGMPAARMGDPTSHGGAITSGSFTVFL